MDRFFDFIGNHPILVSAFLIFLFALIVTERRKGGQSVTTQELVRMTNHESAVLVDLRDGNEFSRAYYRCDQCSLFDILSADRRTPKTS